MKPTFLFVINGALLMSFFNFVVHANVVELSGFSNSSGITGCLTNPTKRCGTEDICYSDRGSHYAITGTSANCNACLPMNSRNIAKFEVPVNLPCAIWRAYGCDDYFVTNIYEKMGENSCGMGGQKFYNIYNAFASAHNAEDTFISQCRVRKSFADYALPANTRLITENEFCSPLKNNITDIKIAVIGKLNVTVLIDYKEYFKRKFNVKSAHENVVSNIAELKEVLS